MANGTPYLQVSDRSSLTVDFSSVSRRVVVGFHAEIHRNNLQRSAVIRDDDRGNMK